MRTATCPAWVPSWVAAAEPAPDAVLAATEVDWRPAGSDGWLGAMAGVAQLADILRDCGPVELREADDRHGRSAVATPVGGGWLVQVRAAPGDGVVEQVGELGAAPSGPRIRVIDSPPWARPAYVGSGWLVRRLRAAEIVAQWVGAGALPSLVATAFLAVEPTP